MNILITGASGFLGWHIARHLTGTYNVYGIAFRHSPVIEGIQWIPHDLRIPQGVDRIFEQVQPDVVVHAAAKTSVKECDSNRRDAIRTNIKATERIAALCGRGHVYLIHISTDLVFDGTKGYYTEEDLPNPISFYGRTKRIAEEVVQRYTTQHTIIRCALLFGPPSPHNRSFLGWMEDGFRQAQPVTLFIDQYRTPLYVKDAVNVVEKLIERRDELSAVNLIHVAGPERLSRVEIGEVYCEVFGFDKRLIKKIRMSEKGEVTNDAPDVSMSIETARRVLNFSPMGVREAFEDIKRGGIG